MPIVRAFTMRLRSPDTTHDGRRYHVLACPHEHETLVMFSLTNIFTNISAQRCARACRSVCNACAEQLDPFDTGAC